jgi:hypothetical protein
LEKSIGSTVIAKKATIKHKGAPKEKMPSVLSTLRASEGRLTFLEKKRKAELKRVGTRDVPILFWTEVPPQGAEEEDTGAYIYVPVSLAPGVEANNLGRKDITGDLPT